MVEKIRKAWYDGRPIVPIVGAGFSADSGYPILNSICRYLARFKYALDKDLLLPRLRDEDKNSLAPHLNAQLNVIIEKAKESPIQYIERFGWPDRFDLAQRVVRSVGSERVSAKTLHEQIEDVITEQFGWLARKSTTTRAAGHWERVRGSAGGKAPSDHWDQWAVQGDWRRLIQFFTGHRGDYGDDLFAQFGFHRAPGPGHRYMTLLCKLLSVKTVFTFNFDDLIEKAFADEGVSFRLFGMERGRGLPSPRVVGDGLAVIKMHGSHHSVLIDEELDRPLDQSYIDRFYELAGQNALLLVLGCSGDDRRLGDILANRTCERTGRAAAVCWLHFEPTSPVPASVRAAGGEKSSPLSECPTNSPAAFVRHVLYDIGGRFPASALPYPSHPATPILYGKPSPSDADPLREGTGRRDSFRSKFEIRDSETLLEYARACVNNGFAVIWVDLESIHTIAGVVGAVIDGCRRIDTELPPAVMPIGDGGAEGDAGDIRLHASEEESLRRLEHALQRQRYAVLVDGINTYGSSLFRHHGSVDAAVAERKTKRLNFFLAKLTEHNIGQSILLVSETTPAPRRSDDFVRIAEGPLATQTTDRPLVTRTTDEAGWAPLFWACLSAVRRTRPLPALRRLVGPLVSGGLTNERRADEELRSLAAKFPQQFRLLEGGELWFVRPARNRWYEDATRYTKSKLFDEFRTGNHPELVPLALGQSLLLGLLHKKIASTYLSFEFMQTADAAAFLEYTYHRVSSIRYLSRVIWLLGRVGEDAWQCGREWIEVNTESTGEWLSGRGSSFSLAGYFGSLWAALQSDSKPEAALARLRDRRGSELEALYASWVEFEQVIRSQIPAEQLIAWIDDFRNEDTLSRLNGVRIGTETEADRADANSQAVVTKLDKYFARLLARIHLERGDYAQAYVAASEGIDRIECLVRNPTVQFVGIEDILYRQADVPPTPAGGDTEPLPATTPAAAPDSARKLSQALLVAGESDEDPGADSEYGHRCRHMAGLVALGRTSWMDGGVRSGRLDPPLAAGLLDQADQAIEVGIERVRGRGARPAEPLAGMFVGSGSPGGAYRPYRATFRILKGRAKVARLLSAELEAAGLEADQAALRAAMRQFDQAKGGLEPRDSLLRGWAHLHAAEAILLFVRRTFDRAAGAAGPGQDYLPVIEAKLRSCRTQLRDGIAALMAGRKNAVWWRHCYQLVAQYHAEWLFVDLCRLGEYGDGQPDRQDRRPDYGIDLLRRYQRSLDAVAGFADYSLDREAAIRSPWLTRTLTEIHLAVAVAVGSHEDQSGSRAGEQRSAPPSDGSSPTDASSGSGPIARPGHDQLQSIALALVSITDRDYDRVSFSSRELRLGDLVRQAVDRVQPDIHGAARAGCGYRTAVVNAADPR